MLGAEANGHNPTIEEDKLIYTDQQWVTEADKPVKITIGPHGASAIKPVTIVSMFKRTVDYHGNRIALVHKFEGTSKPITYREYMDKVEHMAKIFIKLGLERHKGVGIIGFNSSKWFIANMAAIFAGGLAAGIYTTNSPAACAYVAANASCNIIVVENDQQLQKFLEVRDQLPELKAIIQYVGRPSQSYPDVYAWDDLEKGATDESLDEALNLRMAGLAPNMCCTLIYTSGTTGNPKGAMLSHDNLTWAATRLNEHAGTTHKDVLVSYLPLSHIAAQILDIYSSLVAGASVHFARPDALKGTLKDTLQEVRPTVFMGVPRVWEKIHEGMVKAGKHNKWLKKKVIGFARNIGLKSQYSVAKGGRKHWLYPLANVLLFKKVKKILGFDRYFYILSGAAPLRKETMDFFLSLDLRLLEAYGMSECTGVHTLNNNDSFCIGSVGKVYPGVSTHLANLDQDGVGEICMKGRHVFMGYLKEEEKTRDAIDEEGRLRSGDLGHEDARGFLYVTGRIKELIITSGGENIPPVPMEDGVKDLLPCVSNCMVVGDRKKFLSILLTMKSNVNVNTMEPLDTLTDVSKEWCGALGVEVERVSQLANQPDPRVVMAIDSAMERLNKEATSNAQKIQKWTILPVDFSIPGGELGPTMKLKRPFVVKMYADEIENLYKES